MKNGIVILFIALLVAAGIGLGVYAKNQKKAMSTTTATPTMTTTESSGATGITGTPTPTVKVQQIALVVSTPGNGVTLTSPTVVIKGKTLAKADVFVNDTQTTADAQGNFSVTITLDEGENTIIVAANDADGNFTEQELSLTYDSGQ